MAEVADIVGPIRDDVWAPIVLKEPADHFSEFVGLDHDGIGAAIDDWQDIFCDPWFRAFALSSKVERPQAILAYKG
ncbi:hypothetical protein FHR70_003697 [Microvirga lupini]|uniref:Uncharacterized protein n=1 Tax=Microvirga lupini TaxID=420324 RepID=A0A7W4VPE9_9HYPH|nr:hypothetical protein [Microvirga lupini]MBB3020611.1 hypothetical protein [Microvirga lupini]